MTSFVRKGTWLLLTLLHSALVLAQQLPEGEWVPVCVPSARASASPSECIWGALGLWKGFPCPPPPPCEPAVAGMLRGKQCPLWPRRRCVPLARSPVCGPGSPQSSLKAPSWMLTSWMLPSPGSWESSGACNVCSPLCAGFL